MVDSIILYTMVTRTRNSLIGVVHIKHLPSMIGMSHAPILYLLLFDGQHVLRFLALFDRTSPTPTTY